MKKIKILFVILFALALPATISAMELEKFHASPDQVLVLYNEDWVKDTDGSDPGQDSREVAEYYVKRHRERMRGLKPYLLGLHCTHGQKHLNNWFIEEKSQDNKNGVVFKGQGPAPEKEEWPKDSRHVEIVVDNKEGNVDWSSVRIWCSPLKSGEKVKVKPVVSGAPVRKGRQWVYPTVEEGKGRCFRFDAHKLFAGTVSVFFEVKDTKGQIIRDLQLKYFDRDDFVFSEFGKDGITDGKHFQEDVAIPVKRFLEDPENALPDGTLLKDHILYIVVSHGLPFSCEGVFGIERGATDRPNDHGDLASLEQRLQTLYYGWGRQIVPPVISMYMSGGPEAKNGVRNHRITSGMRYSMFGKRWNVYMHPDTYSYLSAQKEPIKEYNLSPFPRIRKKNPGYLFGYGVSRIDGQGPVEAKRLVDYSLYAAKFLRPEMMYAWKSPESRGTNPDEIDQDLKNVYLGKNWGFKNIPELGFEEKAGRGKDGLPFLKFGPELSMNRFRYLPGGMDRVVVSGNGWNMSRDAHIWKQVDEGVSISACGGPAYGGGPHITNATFWDNRILMRYLFRGRDLGECFLLSTAYINWSTSLLGDPLYHPDLSRTVVDTIPPSVAGKDKIQVTLVPTIGKHAALITVPVDFFGYNPELAILDAYYQKVGEESEQSAFSSIFSAWPEVVIRNLEPGTYKVRLVLTDPYRNQSDLSKPFGLVTINVKSGGGDMAQWQLAVKREKGWMFESLKRKYLSEQGTIEVKFEGGKDGALPSIESQEMHFADKIRGSKRSSYKLGGVKHAEKRLSVLEEGEKATLIMRWRRYPLTREILLRADNGAEFTLAADVRTPWEDMVIPDSIIIKEGEGGRILSASIIADAEPASEGAMGVEVPSIQHDAWRAAQQGIK